MKIIKRNGSEAVFVCNLADASLIFHIIYAERLTGNDNLCAVSN